MLSLFKRTDMMIGLIFFLCLGLVLAALFYQHVIGLAPCDLCYKQRWVYYLGIGLLPFGLFLLDQGQARPVQIMLFVFAAAFFANMILGVYHAGVEWKFWDGPSGCSDIGQLDATISVSEAMKKAKVVPCGVAQWRFFGLSMAGYSALFSLLLGALALLASTRKQAKAQ